MVVIHRAIRQDLRRLAACLAGLDEGTPPAQAAAIRHYTAALLAGIRAHHQGEDEVLWPVVAAVAGQSVDLATLADDRQTIEAAVGKTDQALAAFSAWSVPETISELHASVSSLREMLDEHIADEEAQVLRVMRRYLTAGAYRWSEKQVRRKTPLRDRTFAVPWLARYARPGELRPLLAVGGWQIWMLLAAARPRYARLERQAFGTKPGQLAAQRRAQTGERPMSQLHVEAEQTARARPETVWELISDATRYPQWGPWSAAGYQRPGDNSPRGPGAIQWLRSSRRAYLRYPTTIEKILEAEEGRRLAYSVIGGIPVRNYRAEVTLTPTADGTRVRWAATWDATPSGRIVLRGLRTLYPQIVADLVAAAEKGAGDWP